MASFIKYVDITNYICDVFNFFNYYNLFIHFYFFAYFIQKQVFAETASDEYLLATKKIPSEKIFDVNPIKIR